MTPVEFTELLKAFGLPAGAVAAFGYLWLTRQPTGGKSRLEDDISAIRDDVKTLVDSVQDARERLAKLEGRLTK